GSHSAAELQRTGVFEDLLAGRERQGLARGHGEGPGVRDGVAGSIENGGLIEGHGSVVGEIGTNAAAAGAVTTADEDSPRIRQGTAGHDQIGVAREGVDVLQRDLTGVGKSRRRRQRRITVAIAPLNDNALTGGKVAAERVVAVSYQKASRPRRRRPD